MKFDKEYIELAKNEKVQELRPNFFKGDWYYSHKEIKLIGTDMYGIRDKIHVWLPIGDQLDEEIIKIVKRDKSLSCYDFDFYKYMDGSEYSVSVHKLGEGGFETSDETNPLITKIKLLISLLEAK